MHTHKAWASKTTRVLHSSMRTGTRVYVAVFTQWNNLALELNRQTDVVCLNG
jgi:hypothetical protein